MLSQFVWGTPSAIINETLEFNHITTMLKFKLKGASWSVDDKVKSITIKDIKIPSGIDLINGELKGGEATNFKVRGVSPEGVLPSGAGAQFGNEAYIMPIETNKFYIDLETVHNKYENIEITTPDPQFVAGRIYTVSITMSTTDIMNIYAEIEEWSDGSNNDQEVN